jgi:hypothetical protein
VLKITQAQVYAVAATDRDGAEENYLVMVFGKDPEGRPGVFVMANPKEMRENLRISSDWFRDQFLKLYPVTEDSPPTTGGDV